MALLALLFVCILVTLALVVERVGFEPVALLVFSVPLIVAYVVARWIDKLGDRPRTVGQMVFVALLFLFIAGTLSGFLVLWIMWSLSQGPL